jgi:hypothetical protein
MMTEVSKTGYDTTPQDLKDKVEGSMSSEDTGLVMAKTLEGRGDGFFMYACRLSGMV